MAETNVAENKQPETKPAIASMGAVQRVSFTPPVNGNVDEKVAEKVENKEGSNTNIPTEKKLEINDDAIKEWFKSKGMEYEGEEKLKEKLTAKAITEKAEPTEEQKAEQAKAKEKKLLDKWIAGKGTVEQYVAIKNLADADVKELSINTTKKELKDAKFSDEEIEKAMKGRYFQFDDEELEPSDDDGDEEKAEKDFKKRLKEYGANKLANRSSHTKKQAQDILSKLNKEVESEDSDAQDEQKISANIDEKFKAVQRKSTFEIGEVNGKAIQPIESEVPESELAEVHAMFKHPDKRNNILFNQDGSLNYSNIADVFIENTKLKAALKVSYHEGSTRTNEHWQKIFPNETAYALGVGGSSTNKTNGNGKVASFGKTQKTKLSTT